MSDEIKNQDELEDLNVTPIEDEDLESVAGGARNLEDGCTGCGGTGCCTSSAN